VRWKSAGWCWKCATCAASCNSATCSSGWLIGRAPGMQQLRDRLTGLAGSAADVLIHGETGTGKELVARCLHELSRAGTAISSPSTAAVWPKPCSTASFLATKPGAFTGAQQTAHRQDRTRQRWHAVPR
jgi:DNA-binding NtrC family response regulator